MSPTLMTFRLSIHNIRSSNRIIDLNLSRSLRLGPCATENWSIAVRSRHNVRYLRSRSRGSEKKGSNNTTKSESEIISEIHIENLRNHFSNSNKPQPIRNHFLFTAGVIGSSFLAAFIYNYEKWNDILKKLHKGIFNHEDYIGKKKVKVNNAAYEQIKHEGIIKYLETQWMQLTNGRKLIAGTIAANFSVFLLWKIPQFRMMMMKNFTSSLNHPVRNMLTSSFSHISFTHFFFNMYILWSFGPIVADLYGLEQFSAVYLSAATVASLSSIVLLKLLKRPPTKSVGASGAIMGLLGIVCTTYPDAKLSFVFVDQIFPHSFSADVGMKGVLLFDIVGLALGWRFIDHAGHIGGLLFGIFYSMYGRELIWGHARAQVLKQWDSIRKK